MDEEVRLPGLAYPSSISQLKNVRTVAVCPQIEDAQPRRTPMMTVPAGGHRNPLNRPMLSSGQRNWSFGIFDFFGACGTCACACCCPCFVYGQNAYLLKELKR